MEDGGRIADILGDWLERRERGEEVSPEEVIAAHPELEDEIRSHFEILGVVDRAFPGKDLPPGIPRRIGEYQLLRELGRGGMGTVYEAEQTSMNRRVALKALLPSFTGSRQAVRRFEREAQAAGRLHHTNIVPVYGMGEVGGIWFYAMELVEGPPLSRVVAFMRAEGADEESDASESAERHLRTSSRDREHYVRAAEKFAGVAEALHAAHRAGIIHRDVKPQNLLLAPDGNLKLLDFGLARLVGDGGSMTITGQLLGTPHYMSPEQAMSTRVRIDHRTDIYSLGATLYEFLTLVTPFRGTDLKEICSQIIAKDPPAPRRVDPKAPKDLETIVLKAMEKDRDRRYPDAEEMARDLRRFATGAAVQARRPGPIGLAWRKVKRNKVRSALVAALVLVAATAGALVLRSSRHEGRIEEQTERIQELTYEQWLDRAETLFAHWIAGDPHWPEPLDLDEVVRAMTSAVELDPERYEAYYGRALFRTEPLESRLADLELARARGLSAKGYWIAKAMICEELGAAEEAEVARKAGEKARSVPDDQGFREAWLFGLAKAARYANVLSGCYRDHMMGRYDEALRAAEGLQSLEGLMPEVTQPAEAAYLVVCNLRALCRGDEATRSAAEALSRELMMADPLTVAYLQMAAGGAEAARKILMDYEPDSSCEHYEMARIHAALGDADGALAHLEKAIEGGCWYPSDGVPDPELAALKDDPRYRKLWPRILRDRPE